MNPLIARFANEPALLSAGSEDRFRASLEAVVAHPAMAEIHLGDDRAEASDDFWTELGSYSRLLRPYKVQQGILMIPVRGVLLHGFPYQMLTYATGYEYICQALRRGLDDSSVKGIALVIDSPGGMVSGCFDLVDEIYESRSKKPIRAFAAEHAYSAAYAIFSGAEHGTVARTGGLGSIGVVTSHVDLSKMMEDVGYKVTFIHAGKHKVDGNPYEALSEDVRARIQQRIDHSYGIFTSTVARNRGLDEQAVRDTEALCFTASEAQSNGLADAIGALDDALAAFAADLSTPQGDEEMSTQDKPALTQADIDNAVAAATATAEQDRANAVAAAVTAERERISAILGSDEAKGREALADHLALQTDTAADAAVAILGKSPKAEAEGGETPFNATMGQEGANPDVGANPGGGNEDGALDSAESTMALVRGAGLACARRAPAKN